MIDKRIGTDQLNLIMAMYAVYLASGHTLISRQIKAGSIGRYLHAAAEFLSLFDPQEQRDARFLDRTTTRSPYIQRVLDQVAKFEKVPDRQDAYTIAMQKALYTQTRPLAKAKPDCLKVALFQWFGAALQGGNRRCEWCQTPAQASIDTFELSPTGECRAFTLDDITFFNKKKRPLPLQDALQNFRRAHYVRVTYRWQKNGEHGLSKTYARNTSNRACDSVDHFLHICARYVRLVGMTHTDRPLAIYRAKNGTIRNITSADVASVMRALARDVYHIKNKKDAQRFSTHSLRVGACCILWAKGLSGEFIQRALRWKSESWKDYIRDLTIQSLQHNTAINEQWDSVPVY